MTQPRRKFSANEDGATIPGVTIVITCKGRFAHLCESVPCLLRQQTSCEFQIVVVDYGDPERCFDWVVEQNHPQLGAIRVLDNVDEFNLSRARNCGASISVHRLLSFVDADALLAEPWLDVAVAPILSRRAAATIPNWRSPACGICTVERSIFHEVRGFDESFKGWGHEDIDFVERVSQFGAIERYDSNLITLIRHSPDLRVQFYANKDFELTHLENDERAMNRRGLVNPDGYGFGKFLHFVHPSMRKSVTHG